MSSKINVCAILTGHVKTLKDNSTGKVSKWDVFTFFIFPIALAVVSVVLGFKFTGDLISLLVNFGAIFTALLLSVLVLVYDQSSKLKEKELNTQGRDIAIEAKKALLDQLYYNICYSIIVSVSLVVSCFIEAICRGKTQIIELPLEKTISVCVDINTYLASPLVVFLTVNLVLTIIMIVKRMHSLLTTD
ncbi:hypothetical protein [Vibrio harveyi]|uniref:hypothetical protein n=1 Tax=Vibrio harveyi TaxID=669 RepID=UPI0037367A50